MKKKAVITFLGNALFDTRVMNLYSSLKERDIDVTVVCFDYRRSGVTSDNKDFRIYSIPKGGNSLFFYVKFALLLTANLTVKKYDYYFAEDIFTLPFSQLFAGLYNSKLIYDSRELYPFLAGLRKKSTNQKIISYLERRYIYKADNVMVTGEMDGEFLSEYYNLKNILLLRNLPKRVKKTEPVNLRKDLNIPAKDLLIVYQGVLLEGRGIEILIKAVKHFDDVHLIILGDGEFKSKFESLAIELNVEMRVHFLGMLTQDKLLNYTAAADLGAALIENLSKSYYFALPNKLFEYIMAEVPVVVSNLPQMKKVVEDYKVGFVMMEWEVEALVELLGKIKENKDQLRDMKRNASKASQKLNWEREFETVAGVILS